MPGRYNKGKEEINFETQLLDAPEGKSRIVLIMSLSPKNYYRFLIYPAGIDYLHRFNSDAAMYCAIPPKIIHVFIAPNAHDVVQRAEEKARYVMMPRTNNQVNGETWFTAKQANIINTTNEVIRDIESAIINEKNRKK